MIVTFIEKEAQDELVNQFKTEFNERFGVTPEVTIEDQTLVIPTELELVGLEKVVNRFIPPELRKKYSTCLTSKRSRELVILRMIFTMMAKDMGYSLAEIGSFVKRDHSTVIYNIKTGYDLLETDSSFQELYIKISYIVNPKIYPHARLCQISSKTSDLSKPAGPDSLSGPVKYQVKRPVSSRQWGAVSSFQKRLNRRESAVNPQGFSNPIGSGQAVQAFG